MSDNINKLNSEQKVFAVSDTITTHTVLFADKETVNGFKLVKPEDIFNVFELISKQWMLITVEDKGKVNAMTASWGGLGHFWKKDLALCGVRHSRHTFGMIENADTFSLAFFDESFRDKLAYCGKASGRDEDKIAKCGFSIAHRLDTPYIEQASLVLICKKVYADDIKPEGFTDKTIDREIYADKNYHKIYAGEILSVLIK